MLWERLCVLYAGLKMCSHHQESSKGCVSQFVSNFPFLQAYIQFTTIFFLLLHSLYPTGSAWCNWCRFFEGLSGANLKITSFHYISFASIQKNTIAFAWEAQFLCRGSLNAHGPALQNVEFLMVAKMESALEEPVLLGGEGRGQFFIPLLGSFPRIWGCHGVA